VIAILHTFNGRFISYKRYEFVNSITLRSLVQSQGGVVAFLVFFFSLQPAMNGLTQNEEVKMQTEAQMEGRGENFRLPFFAGRVPQAEHGSECDQG